MEVLTFISVLLTYFGMYSNGAQHLDKVSTVITFTFVVVSILTLFYAPYRFDRTMYEMIFINPDSFDKDGGWVVYNRLIKYLVGDNPSLFFLINDTLYTFGFVYFTLKTFDRGYEWYYLLIVVISIGYYSGGTNIMRSGLAYSLVFFGMGLYLKYRNIIPLLIFCIIGCMIHLSTIIILAALLISFRYPKYKLFLCIWVLFLIGSYLNLLNPISDFIIDLMGDDAYRLQDYTENDDTELYTKAGYRFDFIIYSTVPIVFGLYYLIQKKYKDRFYLVIFSSYILINAVWLTVIRMPYTDRMALMSWIFIPIITAYPPLKTQMTNQKQMIFLSILFPFTLQLYYYLS